MKKVILFIIGYLLFIIGNFYAISYSHLFTLVDDSKQYIVFLIRHKECYTLLLGFIIIIITIWVKGK